MPPIEPGLSEADAVLAGELALGVLEGEELAEATRRLIAEPAFAREVERWRDHFAAAALRGPDETPSPQMEQRVRDAVNSAQSGTIAGLSANVAARTARAWRAAAIAFAAAAAVMGALLLRPAAPLKPEAALPPARVLVAALDVSDTHTTLLARIEAGQLRIAGDLTVPAQRDAQAWVIDASGTPHSLGVLRKAGERSLQTAPQRMVTPGQTVAISIEPLGGAPGPVPTGPVVAAGKIEAI